mmetsp:Transcript_49031/g.118768  ORF Transcript_49031/g.118768 Transcript_49031/m.118768 type:complete len:287 (-) Transcript_49031:607-1467(-)
MNSESEKKLTEEEFYELLRNLTLSDRGSDVAQTLTTTSAGDTLKTLALGQKWELLESESKLLESESKLLESESKRLGTFLEDCDGLWVFNYQKIVARDPLRHFTQISRTVLRSCYVEINKEFTNSTSYPAKLPDPSMKSQGSASFAIEGKTDIFNNPYSIKRAHLIPDSPICAPKWGHSCEGAFRPITIVDNHKNEARKLLVMGSRGSKKIRKSLQNFIKFSKHQEFFDVDPSVIIVPIMTGDTYSIQLQQYELLFRSGNQNRHRFDSSFSSWPCGISLEEYSNRY